MKKSLKVLLLSGVTLLMVACMDPQEEPTTEVSSAETTELVEESVESVESVEEEESLAEDANSESSDAESEVASEDNSESSDSNEATSDEVGDDQSAASDDVESTESEVADDEESTESDEADVSDEAVEDATVEIAPVVVEMINQDGDSMGTATFEEAANGVILSLELEGLEEGEYGFHIHEYGKATAPTFMDALGHFNPTGTSHGIHAEGGPHIGDFPNLIVGKDGKVNIVLVVSNVSLDPEAPYTLRTENGTSLIIHEGADDYETQPIGTAGYGMIGGVIFAPMSEEAPATDDETSEVSDEESSNAESESEAATDSESSETDNTDTESSNTSSVDEATESESNSEE